MSLTAIRDRIKTNLEGVTGIGVVHDYERWAINWPDLLTLYSKSAKLNGWAITRRSSEGSWDTMPILFRTHHFEVSGIYSLDDSAASEKTFQDLIEAIEAVFKNDWTLGGTCQEAGPLQVTVVEARMFGSVLCHYCLLELTAVEREVVNA